MNVARQTEMLANRVRKTFARLHPRFERRGIGAFRLYDRDIPEIRAAIDWYEGHLVVAEYARQQTDRVPGWLPAMADAVAAALGVPPERVHLRRRRTRPARGPRYEPLAPPGSPLEVREGDLRFLVDLDARLDTGLFADHRETRGRLRAESRGRRFLNLFGYTGTFTCAAAAGGAVATTTVDRSAVALRRARENLARNGLWSPRHELVRADVVPFLARARSTGRTWDLCLLDPPSFSTRRGAPTFDVQRDHRELIERTLEVLAPGGVLYFSTNHQRFEPRLEGLPAEVREITGETVPEDYRNRTVHRCWRITVPARAGPGGRSRPQRPPR